MAGRQHYPPPPVGQQPPPFGPPGHHHPPPPAHHHHHPPPPAHHHHHPPPPAHHHAPPPAHHHAPPPAHHAPPPAQEQVPIYVTSLVRPGVIIRFNSVTTGKYIAVERTHQVHANGDNSPSSHFRIQPGKVPGTYQFESIQHPRKFLRMYDGRADCAGTGGKWCNLRVVFLTGEQEGIVCLQGDGGNLGFKPDGCAKNPNNTQMGARAQFQFEVIAPPEEIGLQNGVQIMLHHTGANGYVTVAGHQLSAKGEHSDDAMWKVQVANSQITLFNECTRKYLCVDANLTPFPGDQPTYYSAFYEPHDCEISLLPNGQPIVGVPIAFGGAGRPRAALEMMHKDPKVFKFRLIAPTNPAYLGITNGARVRIFNAATRQCAVLSGNSTVFNGDMHNPGSVFIAHVGGKGHVKFESAVAPGAYINIDITHKPGVGRGGKFCKLYLVRLKRNEVILSGIAGILSSRGDAVRVNPFSDKTRFTITPA